MYDQKYGDEIERLHHELDAAKLQKEELEKKYKWVCQQWELDVHMKDVYSNLAEKRQEIIDKQERLVEGMKKIVDAAVGVYDHGSDYRYGTHATILWDLVRAHKDQRHGKRNDVPPAEPGCGHKFSCPICGV